MDGGYKWAHARYQALLWWRIITLRGRREMPPSLVRANDEVTRLWDKQQFRHSLDRE